MRCCDTSTTRDNESFGDEAVDAARAAVDGVDPQQIFKTLVVALPKDSWRWRCCRCRSSCR